jgi:hypothetical protein
MGRTNLTRRAHTLQLSLLASLGLVPLACGGSAVTIAGDAGSGASSGFGGSPVTYGGDGPVVSRGGGELGGSPNYGGTTGFPGGFGGGVSLNRACEKPTLDPVTQLVKCQNGFEHRPVGVTCGLPLGAAGAPGEGGAAGAPGNPACTTDADCSSLRLGYCDYPQSFGLPALPSCQSGCLKDEDCGSGAVCDCNGTAHGGNCVIARCQTDAQCGSGLLCATVSQICGPATFACQLPQDTCNSSADCGGGSSQCSLAFESGYRACSNAVCGRPFLVAEAPRLAEIAASSEWLGESPCLPSLDGLGTGARTALAVHWARLAQMEHASIAAFARFSLQLLSLGAPPSLIEACTRAIADETAHTRLCFELASHYGGTPLGPGPLDIGQCLDVTSLTEIMKLVLAEGCLGETCAALEALEAAATATDPAVKQAFTRIARDEQRHAELAFRFLKWALAQAPAQARSELAREAERRLHELERATHPSAEPDEPYQAELSAHGCLPARTLQVIRRHAARAVVAPLLGSLGLGRASAQADFSARARAPEPSQVSAPTVRATTNTNSDQPGRATPRPFLPTTPSNS